MTMDLTDDAQKVVDAAFDENLNEVGAPEGLNQSKINTQPLTPVYQETTGKTDTQPVTAVYQEQSDSDPLVAQREAMKRFAEEERAAREKRNATNIAAGQADVDALAQQTGTNPVNPAERNSGGTFGRLAQMFLGRKGIRRTS